MRGLTEDADVAVTAAMVALRDDAYAVGIGVGDVFLTPVDQEDGRVAVTYADCPGTDCVHSGWVSAAGRAVVCLPNRVEIRLTGAPGVDAVVG